MRAVVMLQPLSFKIFCNNSLDFASIWQKYNIFATNLQKDERPCHYCHMKTIIDIGKQGSEQLPNIHAPGAEVAVDDPDLAAKLAIIRRFPRQTIEAPTADGVLRTVTIRTLLLHNSRVFDLVHSLAPYEPMVYAHTGGRTVLGMLSPNYDPDGQTRLPAIKIIPLQKPYPLTPQLQPDARMTTMLAGAVGAERKGVGSHTSNMASDLEHKATILGAISVGNPDLALSHQNHGVRARSAVATGLTNGRLGNLYAPDASVSEFPGYGSPIVIHKEHATLQDMLFLPDSFLDDEQSFGVALGHASKIMLGAGLQVLYGRQRDLQAVNDQLQSIGRAL
jgi:hypothetical protein